MKFQKIVFLLAIVALVFTGCKKEEPKEIALNISGMTCEIGCAKMIQSKLSKHDGVLDAKVVFEENMATVKYDASKTNTASLISLVEGIAGGEMYKASEGTAVPTTKKTEACTGDCKEACASSAAKEHKACIGDCKEACAADDSKEHKACDGDCKEACAAKEKA